MQPEPASTTRQARPSESRPARPGGRWLKITQLRQTRYFRIFPTKLLMRGPVQRCERLSACQALQMQSVFNIPALRDVFPDATKVQCDSRVPQNTSTGRGNRKPQLRCDFLVDRADPIHDFSKFHSPAISRLACGKPAAPHSTKISPA